MNSLTLIALAHAGGSAASLAQLRRHLPEDLTLRPVELPGHGARLGQPLLTSRAQLVSQLARELADELRGPYALFGHSLGGMLAFELGHALCGLGLRAPRALCVAATPAPSRQWRQRGMRAACSDAELMAAMRNLGATPAELFQHPELLELFLPIVRADFQLCDDAPASPPEPLPCPVHVYAGRKDELDPDGLRAWREFSSRSCSFHWFDGDHFFVHSHAAALGALLGQQLGALRAPATWRDLQAKP